MLMEIIKKRRSIRRFKDKEVSEDIIDELVEALIWAPSAGNLQSRRFIFVKDRKIKLALAREAYEQYFISEAPLVVVGCADTKRVSSRYGLRGVSLYAIQDVACSLMQMMLVAEERGVGTVWVGAFDEKGVSKILNLPHYLRPVAIVPVGYPAETPIPTPRLSREQIIVYV